MGNADVMHATEGEMGTNGVLTVDNPEWKIIEGEPARWVMTKSPTLTVKGMLDAKVINVGMGNQPLAGSHRTPNSPTAPLKFEKTMKLATFSNLRGKCTFKA